jgi:hypothetical protein
MTDFNEKAGRPEENDRYPLAGYMGFSFGEGQKNSNRYRGGLLDRQHTGFGEWKPDCLIYSARFDLGKKLPTEDVQKEAILKFFKEQGATVSEAKVTREEEAEAMGHDTRIITVQLPLKEIEKAKAALLNIDMACNGFYTRRLKAPKLNLQP